ncbi:unnamed protein product [Rotaria sp. Silwood1]|nr:unnamed protein product [Rotaria sp. Silwood1]CAF1471947.1 unnamed protein product [Rotaria sp. Silwood1]
MASLAVTDRFIELYLGLFFLILGPIGTIMQIFILTTVSYYRTTPCTFYFFIASIRECGLFIAAVGPLVFATILDIDITRISVVWCKLRFFLALSSGAVSSACTCLATIDQFLVTSQHDRFRQLSNIKNAHRVSLFTIIIWWLHDTLWLYYQDMSPVTGVCTYKSNMFFLYAILFICIILCGIPILIMMISGILSYRNIRKTIVLLRLRVDRQMTIIVFIQVVLTLIGLSPFGIYTAYAVIAEMVQKNTDKKVKNALISNITYLFCSVAYGVSVLKIF